jgi:general secretion pathway protein J
MMIFFNAMQAITVKPKLPQRAFTLVEMLVVMVIVSLMVTLIIQGFGYSLGLYQRAAKVQRSAYEEIFAYNWMRETLQPQLAARPKDLGLEGGSVELSTYSFHPLIERAGIKTRITWLFEKKNDGVSLLYRENSKAFVVYSWPNTVGNFEYLDEKGQWINHWPPEKTDAPKLPEAVRLALTNAANVRNYVIAVSTRKRPDVSMDEAQYGR